MKIMHNSIFDFLIHSKNIYSGIIKSYGRSIFVVSWVPFALNNLENRFYSLFIQGNPQNHYKSGNNLQCKLAHTNLNVLMYSTLCLKELILLFVL